MNNALSRELETYEQNKDALVAEHDGRFVVIRGDQIAGTWETFAEAVQKGYERFGLESFLVKRIEAVETVHNLSRGVPCQF